MVLSLIIICVYDCEHVCANVHACIQTTADVTPVTYIAQTVLSALLSLKEEITLCHFLLLLKEEGVM